MIIVRPPELEPTGPCPYLPNRTKQFINHFAKQLTAEEISLVLARGWRKFGPYYFRPKCPGCRDCIPLRVLVQEFKPSKSQRKSLRKNDDIRVEFGPLSFSKRIYKIYRDHSQNRFEQKRNSLEGFLFNFYTPSCPSLQSEFYLDDELLAVGFLDVGDNCLSSVYFVFDTSHSRRGLGTFSILKEIEYAQQLGLEYYYLGYYVADCHSMAYKDRFKPREHYNWAKQSWHRVES